MGFLALLVVASMPVLQFLLVGLVGAFLASGYSNILSPDARRDTNKIVFYVFTPALIFASLAKIVTLHDIISWWFMPVNIAITFLIGTMLGWLVIKILRPDRHLEGLIIASCSAGNLGNLMVIIIPAICNEDGNPFGDPSTCNDRALSYGSLSMALGGFFIWTHTYSLMKRVEVDHVDGLTKVRKEGEEDALFRSSSNIVDEAQQSQTMVPLLSGGNIHGNKVHCWGKIKGGIHQITDELTTPPSLAAVAGFVIGVVPWLKSLIIGASAPLRVIQDSVTVLGNGTIPCSTLILGGNLTKGLRRPTKNLSAVLGTILARYVFLPVAGIAVVKAAGMLRFLPPDPLYQYALLIQFALPPAMSIGTMAQLFDVGQEECSVIFLWTYLAAAPALTIWSTVFMWFMPVNIAITFLLGGILGWLVVKIFRPDHNLEGLVIANSSAAVYHEDGNPFGDPNICNVSALSYVSMSMALGAVFICTYTYCLMNKVDVSPKKITEDEEEAALLLPLCKLTEEDQQEPNLPPLLAAANVCSSNGKF